MVNSFAVNFERMSFDKIQPMKKNSNVFKFKSL